MAGESCDLNFNAALVLDTDGTPDALTDPGTIHFAVIAPPPNEAPTLVSTVPTQSATNFPSAGDLKAVFSEPVTASAGAFALSCTNSSGIVLTPSSSDGGINWTIDTGTALVAGDSCQFSIVAAFIHDLEGAELDAGNVIAFNVLDAGNVGAYYENVNLSSPEQLRCSLHEIIKGHTVYPYSGSGTSSWSILEIAQEDPNNSNRIIDVYRNRSYAKGSDRAGQGGGITYNREHTWPNS
ncbi:MAG: Ig-like domain-containing protein, partial [Xanthomonadales bacterium]|nr:Ig-like domain-containing protein [Xanthomonadales bacterium]